MPLQAPSRPHVMAPASAHSMAGSCPAGTLVQVPALPESAHDLHVPEQAIEQQTPCAQIPELHSTPSPQVAPSGFLPQLPITHVLGATQLRSMVHVVRHCPLSPQVKGAHDWLAAPAQVPMPSQRPADCSEDPVHPACWQIVPAE
jgi:hypothetical protein